ncbi:MAG: hypothetical protein LAQ30_28865, partial [Acidobacteriia bacterium]|nr:hypothetical protein [Terriglobia bacterium]
MRAAGGQLQGGRSRVGAAEPVPGRRLPGRVLVAARGRVWLADQHGSLPLDSGERRGAPAAGFPRLPVPRGGPGCLDRLARPHGRRPHRGVGVNGSSAQPAARQAAPPVPPRKEVQPERTAATPAPPPAVDPVQERILALVAEKTGYPREMLALDLDLEADLGVDTVKQAEVFAAVREIYQIPRETNLKLRDFPTVAHVIRFVQERVGPVSQPAAASAPPPAAEPAAPQPAPEVSGVREKVLAIVAEKTGYPREMLDLDLDLEADLGIDTVKQAEMFASVRAAFDIPREGNLKLRDFPTLAHVIRFAEERGQVGPASEPAAAASTLPPPREPAAPQPAP